LSLAAKDATIAANMNKSKTTGATKVQSFADFKNKLAAKWRSRTTHPALPQPKKSDEIYTILSRLVSIPTITGNYEANHDALDYIEAFLAKRGLHVKRLMFNGIESMVATIRKTKTPLIMLGAHLDVVSGPEELFELHEVKGKLYGRGVLDMKYAIATYLQILDELPGKLTDYDLGIVITTDEEAGGNDGMGTLVEAGYLPKVCILPDGGDDWQIQTSAKGFTGVKVVAEGKAAHGSRPWMGDNAIMKLTAALTDIQQLFAEQNAETSTCNVGLINGGKVINQIPDYAEASLDIRVISEADRTKILNAIDKICKKRGTSFSLIWSGLVCSFDLENPYIQPFKQQIERVTGIQVSGSHALGGSDARFFMPHKVPCVSFYPKGGNHHSDDEWLSKEGLYQFKDILKGYIEQITTNPPQ